MPPIVAYCLASISMVLLNKWVLSGTHFDMTFLRKSGYVHCAQDATDA